MKLFIASIMAVTSASIGYADVRRQEFPLPEGNHRVTITFAATTQPQTVTVKAEMRRVMLDRVTIPAGQTFQRIFTVNTRTDALPDGRRVNLHEREVGRPHWDEKLTLEFLGDTGAVVDVFITEAPRARTIFLAGDSTVTDQAGEPYAGWGQMLPLFVGEDVAVANYAESGRSLTSFANERRLNKVLSVTKPGDFLFIQFGHNDMKERGEGIGAFGNFSANLRDYIAKARAAQMTPVLITSMHRRRFDASGQIQNTFGDYVEATRRVAAEQNVPLIDLNNMSEAFYEALGVEGSKRALVHYPANTFPNQAEALKDDTHHNAYGAYQLAKCVVEGLRTSQDVQLRGLLRDGIQPFDPARPDDVDAFDLPASPPLESTTRPAGS